MKQQLNVRIGWRHSAAGCLVAFCLALLLFGAGGGVRAQTDIAHQQMDVIPKAEENGFGFRQGSFVVAPVPFQSPTFGSGLALGAGYLFKSDASSNTSGLGLGGFRTSNGSSGYGAAGKLLLNDNRWIISASAGLADLRYDLFVLGTPVPIRQNGEIARLGLSYGVTRQLSFGVALLHLGTDVTLDTGAAGPLPPSIRPDSQLKVLKTDFLATWDRRDDTIYPTTGSKLAATVSYGSVSGLTDRGYQKATLLFDMYFPVGASGVIASRLAACGASSNAPFFDKCGLGGVDKFRGFPSTQFIGTRLASVQVAFRQRLSKRFGVVAFAGAGAVSEFFGTGFSSKTHTAAGFGLRYRLSKKFPLDYSVDASVNDDGDKLLYIYVGQRF